MTSTGPQDQRLSELLLTLRRREKLSRAELGCRIGLHRNVVCKLERDPGNIRIALLRQWCAVLNEPYVRVLRFAEKAPPEVQPDK